MTSITSFTAGSISYSSATLSWSGTYNSVILYQSTNNSTYSTLATSYDTSYNLTSLSSNTLYYYKVVPYDSSGNSGTSETTFFTTSTQTVINSFYAGSSTSSMIPLYWQGTFYSVAVYYQKYDDLTYSLYSNVTGVSNVNVTGLTSDTSYNFYITPYDVYYNSGTSSSVITVSTDYVPFVGNIYLGSVAATSVVLNWDGEYSYVTIQKSLDGVNYSTDIKLYAVDSSNSSVATDSSFSITTLYPYTTYYFRIIPYSANYNAGSTSTITYTTTLMGIDLFEVSGNIYNNNATMYWEGIYTRMLIYRVLDNTALVIADISNTTTSTTTGTYTATGLSSYKNYYFYIQPYNVSTKTTISDALSVTTDFSAQVGLTTSHSDTTTTSIKTTLSANGYTSPYYYTALLQISTDNSTYTDLSLIAQQTSLSSPATYTISSLSSNTLYYVRVNPYSLYNVSGGQTTASMATLGYIDNSNISLYLDSSNQIVISCSGCFSSVDIQYYYGTSDGTYTGTISDVSYALFPYTISSSVLSSQYPYYFYMIPYNLQDYSGTISDYLYNPVVTSFYITNVSGGFVTLYWAGNYDNVSIQKRDYSGNYYTDLSDNINSSQNTINIAASPATTTTYYRLVPYNSSDVSGLITSEIFIPTVPSIEITGISQYDISMTWTGIYDFAAVQYSTTSSTSGFTTLFDISTSQYDLSGTNVLDISRSIISTLDASSNTYYFRIVPYSYGTGIYGNTYAISGLSSNSVYNSSITYLALANPSTNPTYRINVNFSGTFSYAQLYYRDASSSYSSYYIDISSVATSYTVGALTSNTQYYFKLRHYNDNDLEGIMHSEMSIYTASLLSNISATYDSTSSTSSSVVLTWTDNNYYSYVYVYDPSSVFLEMVTDNSFNSDGIQTTLSANTGYTYTLQFYDSFGNMEYTTVTAYTSASTKDIQVTSNSTGLVFNWDNTGYDYITIQNISTMSNPITFSVDETQTYDSYSNETYNTGVAKNTANRSLLPETDYEYMITVTNRNGDKTSYNITASTGSDYSLPTYSLSDIYSFNSIGDLELNSAVDITGNILTKDTGNSNIKSFDISMLSGISLSSSSPPPSNNMYYYYPLNYDMNNYVLGHSVTDAIGYNDITIGEVNGYFDKPRSLVLNSDKKQYLELPPIKTTSANGMTLSFWFKNASEENVSVGASIFDFMGLNTNTNHLSATIVDSSNILITYSTDDYSNSMKLNFNTGWNHIVAVFTKYGKWEGYVNGKKIVRMDGNCPVLNIGSKNYIGMNIYTGVYFNGYIDDFRLYKTALTNTDIEAIVLRGAWKILG